MCQNQGTDLPSGPLYSHEGLVFSGEGNLDDVIVDPQTFGGIIIHQLLSIGSIFHLDKRLKNIN